MVPWAPFPARPKDGTKRRPFAPERSGGLVHGGRLLQSNHDGLALPLENDLVFAAQPSQRKLHGYQFLLNSLGKVADRNRSVPGKMPPDFSCRFTDGLGLHGSSFGKGRSSCSDLSESTRRCWTPLRARLPLASAPEGGGRTANRAVLLGEHSLQRFQQAG